MEQTKKQIDTKIPTVGRLKIQICVGGQNASLFHILSNKLAGLLPSNLKLATVVTIVIRYNRPATFAPRNYHWPRLVTSYKTLNNETSDRKNQKLARREHFAQSVVRSSERTDRLYFP
jgi:hypothetical protein